MEALAAQKRAATGQAVEVAFVGRGYASERARQPWPKGSGLKG